MSIIRAYISAITKAYIRAVTPGNGGGNIPEIEGVTIGTQTWATSNLEMVATPMDNEIPEVTDAGVWGSSATLYSDAYTAATGTEAEKVYAGLIASAMWCYYNNDPVNGATYGKLYNWYAAKLLQADIDAYNAANPTTPWGWKVPTDAEWTTLSTYLGGEEVAGGKMKTTGTLNWVAPNEGATNESGFSGLPGGCRSRFGFSDVGYVGYWWSSTEYSSSYAWSRTLYLDGTNVGQSYDSKGNGFSLRLLKS